MKKLTVALFGVLFAAVIALYLVYFLGDKKNRNSTEAGNISEIASEGIAFINIDSVIFKFDMFFDRREELMEKQKKAEAELNSKGSQYEKNARDYQDKINKGLVTRATAAEMEQSLMQQQQDLLTLRDNLQSNLVEEEQVMNRQILEYITTYLDENKSEYNYQYILGKSFGSVVLYGDSALDITQKVIDAINIKYQAEKK